MNRRTSSLDSRLLALLTVSFSLLCASALWLDFRAAAEQPTAERNA
jgi:hypothetical protein